MVRVKSPSSLARPFSWARTTLRNAVAARTKKKPAEQVVNLNLFSPPSHCPFPDSIVCQLRNGVNRLIPPRLAVLGFPVWNQ